MKNSKRYVTYTINKFVSPSIHWQDTSEISFNIFVKITFKCAMNFIQEILSHKYDFWYSLSPALNCSISVEFLSEAEVLSAVAVLFGVNCSISTEILSGVAVILQSLVRSCRYFYWVFVQSRVFIRI